MGLCKDPQSRDQTSATPRTNCAELQQRVTRPRVEYCKLLGFSRLLGPLWIRRVLVRAQEGQLEARYHDEWCRASCVLALSLRPEPLEAVREFRTSVTLVRELADEQRERLRVTGDP